MQSERQRADNPIGWLIDAIRTLGRENLFGRFWGLYRAEVIDVADPDQRGRVRVLCPAFGHSAAADVLPDRWADPIMPGLSGKAGFKGLFWPPDKGDLVWIMCENGEVERQHYIGGWMLKKNGWPLQHAEAKYKGMMTGAGHFLRFSDVDDNRHIRLAHGKGNGEVSGTYVEIAHDGSVTVETKDGAKVVVSTASEKILVQAKDGSKAELGKNAVLVQNQAGTKVQLDGPGVTVQASGEVKISGAKIVLDAPFVDVGQGALEPAVKGAQMQLWAQVHTHGTAAPGAPTVPGTGLPPVVVGQHLSTGVRLA